MSPDFYIMLVGFLLALFFLAFFAGYLQGKKSESEKNYKQKQAETAEREKFLKEKEKTEKEIIKNGEEEKKDLHSGSNSDNFNNSLNKLRE